MKKFSALLLLFAALACTSATPPAPKQAEDRVSVAIESRPDASEVWVDSKFVGTTPMVARLTPGEHAIDVRNPNRASWKRELTVIPNSPTRIMALLADR
jgi:hypothetical protein